MISSVKAGLTTSALLKSIKRRSLVPDNQNTFSDQDFIDIMNEEMMISCSFYKRRKSILFFKQITPLVADKSNYPIPERALANKLREICFRDSATDNFNNEYEMTQIAIDDRYTGLSNGTGSSDFTGFRRFYVMGSDVILHPNVGPSPYGALVFFTIIFDQILWLKIVKLLVL